MQVDLLTAFVLLAVWTVLWVLAVDVYLNRWEARRGYPSRRHRFALLFIGGPLVWLAMTWDALEDGRPDAR